MQKILHRVVIKKSDYDLAISKCGYAEIVFSYELRSGLKRARSRAEELKIAHPDEIKCSGFSRDPISWDWVCHWYFEIPSDPPPDP
jgi:hypothetical protein